MSNFCRELCEAALLEEGNDFKIGGPGCTVEIDESLFRKRKYHRGKKKSGEMWVFGGFCRETGDCFLEYVPDRSANTLIPIIKRRISNGTRIISDCWKAYARLKNDIDYTYFSVNHSIEFVSKNDPPVHTNSIEGCWRLVKRNLPVTGTTVEMQESYLSEFMWRKKRRNENSFVALLYDIANVYRLDHIEIEQLQEDVMQEDPEILSMLQNCYVKVDWEQTVDPDVYQFYEKLGKELGTKVDMILSSVICMMPCVFNKKTSIGLFANKKRDMHTTIYSWIVIPSGTGKSSMWNGVLHPCLEAVARKKDLDQYILQSYTAAGLMETVVRNGGEAFIGSAEGRVFLEGMRQRNKTGGSERTMINETWSKSTYTSTLRRTNTTIKDSHVMLQILVQPIIVVEEICQEKTATDKYLMRPLIFVPFVGERLRYEDLEAQANNMDKDCSGNIVEIFEQLAEMHKSESDGARYVLDEMGTDIVREQYNARNPDVGITDGSERDFEQIIRISLALHVHNHGHKNFGAVAGRKLRREDVPFVIEGRFVRAAQQIFAVWKQHKDEIFQAAENIRSKRRGLITRGKAAPKEPISVSVWKKLGSRSGNICGVRTFYRQMYGGRKNTEVTATLYDMGSKGGITYISADKKEGIKGDVICKIKPEDITDLWLERFGLTIEEYTQRFVDEMDIIDDKITCHNVVKNLAYEGVVIGMND